MLNGQTLRFSSAVNDALPRDMPDDVIQGWNNNPQALKEALAKALLPPALAIQHIIVQKTIRLGNGFRTSGHFWNIFRPLGMSISQPAMDLIDRSDFKTSPTEVEIDLVIIPVRLLGFKLSPTRKEIISRGLEKGYQLCPAEVGPQLRLQYPDQPRGDLVIAMEPVWNGNHQLNVFSVDHTANTDEYMWLSIDSGNDNHTWNIDKRFVFVKPRE